MQGTAAKRLGRRPWFGPLLAGCCLSAILPVALAQPGPLTEDAAIARALGNGLHSFYGGDYQRAYDDLTEAVAAGSRDPRAFYFRGLAARRMGRIDEAEADFSQAATMEATGLGAWPVSRTLERVQGEDRLALERHRVRSRIAVLQGRREAAERRYSQIDSVQEGYLRRTRPKDMARDAAAEFERGSPPEPIPPGLSTEPGEDAPAAETEPEMTEEPAEREAPPVEAEKPMAEEEPLGDPAGKAEEEAMAEEPPAAADDDPAEMAEDPEMAADPPPADAPGDVVFEE